MKKRSSKKPSKKAPKQSGIIAQNNPPACDLDDLSFDRLPRTYTGLLDDVMIRYSEDYAGKDFFNRMIAKNIFFGGGFYINDGYLVNHATAREYLYNQDSLLRHMMSTGFIQVLTRKESAKELAEMPVEMAKGNASYNRLVNSAEWPEFSRLFKGISRGLFANKNQRLWPAFDMSQGFTNLMRQAFASNAKDVGIRHIDDETYMKIMAAFLQLEPWKGNARASLEDAALLVLTGRPDRDPSKLSPRIRKQMNDLMGVANQAYHYNFGLTLTEEEDFGIAADTTFGMAFDELTKSREIQQGTLDNVELLSLPEGLPYDFGPLFHDFLDEGTSVCDAKVNYLNSLNQLLTTNSSGIDEAKKRIEDATELYVDRIIKTLQKSARKFTLKAMFANQRAKSLQVRSVYLAKDADDQSLAVAADSAGIAVTISAATTGRKQLDFLIERLRIQPASDNFNTSRKGKASVVKLSHIRPQLTSLVFSEEAAKNHVKHLTRFNQPKKASKK